MRLKTTRTKTAKNRSISSTQWLNRHLNDEYVLRSQKDGYRSRAAYKLEEINKKFSLLKPSQNIVDLGAAPGGWSQIAAKIIGKKGRIVAIDLLEMPQIENIDFLQGDFCDPANIGLILTKFHGKIDVILSDMAPNTTGHKGTDHLRIIDLCERVFNFANLCLANDGSMVIKIFQGGAEASILGQIKQKFREVRHFKPNSSRKESSEIYLIAKGFKRD